MSTDVQELYSEHCKTLQREIKEGLNTWKDISLSCVRRLSVLKMSILPTMIYRFDAIPIKVLAYIFLKKKLTGLF